MEYLPPMKLLSVRILNRNKLSIEEAIRLRRIEERTLIGLGILDIEIAKDVYFCVKLPLSTEDDPMVYCEMWYLTKAGADKEGGLDFFEIQDYDYVIGKSGLVFSKTTAKKKAKAEKQNHSDISTTQEIIDQYGNVSLISLVLTVHMPPNLSQEEKKFFAERCVDFLKEVGTLEDTDGYAISTFKESNGEEVIFVARIRSKNKPLPEGWQTPDSKDSKKGFSRRAKLGRRLILGKED
jgi:hypothetical protein